MLRNGGGNSLRTVYYTEEKTFSGWKKLNTNGNHSSTIPASTKFIAFSADYLFAFAEAVTIGPQLPPNQSRIIESGITTRIIRGTAGRYGIEAEGEQDQAIEVSFTHPDMAELTQGYIGVKYDFGCYEIFEGENHNYGNAYYGDQTIRYTAITPTGEVELTHFFPKIMGGIIGYVHYMYIPPMTSEVRLSIEFKDVNIEPESPVKRVVYLLTDTYDSESADETKICQFMRQDGFELPGNSDTGFDLEPGATPSAWYDIDGDGVMEWYASSKLMQFTPDKLGQLVLSSQFGPVEHWCDYGDENRIGYIDTRSVSSVAIDAVGAVDCKTLTTIDSGEFTTIDYDNDGRTDFLVIPESSSQLPTTVCTMTADGSVSSKSITVMTPKEYYNDYDVAAPPGGVVSTNGLGSGLSFVGGGDKSPAGTFSDSQFQIIDLNNDGYPDFVNANGTYLMNMRNSMFVGGNIGGRVVFRDFDGDGLNDKLTYDASDRSLTVTFQRPEGQEPEDLKLFSGLNCNRYVWCRDFDRDGDVDILVPFDGPDNGNQSYLVMFENKGNGTFKRNEYFIDGNVCFATCGDFDADGNYEILATENSTKVMLFRLDGLTIDETGVEIADNIGKNLYAADFDNSGKTRIIHSKGYMNFPGDGINTRPEAPAKPTVTYNAASSEVTVEWGAGNDKETAPTDLTYSLRIGTAPGLDDIVCADATPDGLRRNLSEGNCGYSRMRKFNSASWPMGKIYVSVQSVDDSRLGSEFSEYAVIEKTLPPASFIISADRYHAVDDEALISMSASLPAGCSVSWDVDGGIISEQTATSIKVRWLTPGTKTVSLIVTSSQGVSATITQELRVNHVRLIDNDFAHGRLTLDMDCDGTAETLFDDNRQYNKSAAFYEGNAEGEYTRIKRLFNTALNDYKFITSIALDINRDGMPDVVAADKNDKLTYLINEGDLSMEIQTLDEEYVPLIVDLDNDGMPDPAYTGIGNIIRYYDYDADGLIDIIACNDDHAIVYKNHGDYVFSEVKRYEVSRLQDCAMGDFDADGLADMAKIDSGNLVIMWGDGTETRVEPFGGLSFNELSAVYDLDNNGSMDIICEMYSGSGSYTYTAAYFNEDHTFDVETILEEYLGMSDCIILTRTDGTLSWYDKTIKGRRENTPPTTPTGLKATNDGMKLTVEWEASTDAESFSKGLRYNISIRRIDAGNESYLISPLNGGKDGVPVPSTAQLLNSTRYTLPLSVVPNGEYEIKVQAVDSRLATSAFSQGVTVQLASPSISYMPEETMVWQNTEIRLKSGVAVSEVDFGEDSEVVDITGNTVTVVWQSEGIKTITAPDFTATITVHPYLNAGVYFMEGIRRFDKVITACDNVHNSVWEIYRKNSSISWGGNVDETWTVLDDENSAVKITPLEEHLTRFEFMYTDFYEMYTPNRIKLRHTLSASYGTSSAEMDVAFEGTNKDPNIIQIIDIDEASGCHIIRLSEDGRNNVIGYNLYRETSRSGEYELIGSAPASEDYIIDHESTPGVKASRYRAVHILNYGESAMSLPHQPMHVTINVGQNNSWNLIWSPYEGVEVTTYRILRGTSASTLECIDEVSGNINSYTDFNAPNGHVYYAIEILAGSSEAAESRSSREVLRSRSNTVCSDELSAIESITADEEGHARYYDLSGRYVGNNPDELTEGVYIKQLKSTTEKVIIRK